VALAIDAPQPHAGLRIWGRRAAFNVQKVLWCAEELGLDYERVDAGMHYGVVGTDAYALLNPNRRVPTLEDGELVLWESNAIVRYLSARYGMGSLCPEDLAHRADVDRWMDWQAATLYYPAFRAYYLGVTRDNDGLDAAGREAARLAVVAILRILDAHLGTRDYVGGAGFTMGDIPLGVVVDKWMRMPIERPSMPGLVAYYARLCERAPYRACVAHISLDAV
jgi:glutathione S-transferase